MEICIATDFTDTPGSRYRTEGDFSGEEFRETILEPKFLAARKRGEKLVVNLDGGYGYPTSFLEEAFGGLARLHGAFNVLETLEYISQDEPSLIEEIRGYISAQK